jgi:hypothetical protein
MPWLARSVAALALLSLVAATASAQNIRSQIRDVFRFGTCEGGQLICLSDLTGEHGSHFNPDAAGVGEALIDFLSANITTSVGNVPLGATSSGRTFSFDATGAPIVTAQSTGPILGERSQTLGRSRAVIGVHLTRNSLRAIRGVPLTGLQMTLTHQDTDGGGVGDPDFERDTIHVATSLEGSVDVLSLFATYGLTSNIDIGVAVPVVRLDFDGRSIGTIVPTSSTVHYFGGTATDPQLVDTASSSGSTTGIGDVSVRVKFNLAQGRFGGAAFLTDVRLPTGDRDDLLGAGKVTVGGTFIIAATFDRFTPHLNAGYLYRAGEDRNKAYTGSLGFDALVAPQLTLAADLLGQWEIGESNLELPPPAVFVDGTTVRRTNIPTMHDDIVGASVGAKWVLGGDLIAVGNVIMPMSEGGLRSNAIFTIGLQRPF